ncbi:MAG: ferrous iron transport protein A [Planctomycetales bacterium]
MTAIFTLDALPQGAKGRIREIEGEDALAVRLLEMGLTEGEEIHAIGRAPLGDPLEFLVRGYRLSLRIAEARRVKLEPDPARS